MNNLLLIGCGHMGEALLKSWFNSKKYSLSVVDPIKYNLLKKKYKNKKIKLYKYLLNIENITKYDFIIFAVRPLDLDSVLKDLESLKPKSKTLFISVIAGKKIVIFQKKFKNIKNFFRVMPNMPASVGESMNCIVSNKNINIVNKKRVDELFSYSGKTIFLKNENQIDMATAISGSGPGFVYNTIDAMIKAAVKLGFKNNIAKTLVEQTFKGSIILFSKNNITAEKLVKTVATKGGTTEAGLKIMKKNKFHKIFEDLTKSSYVKARQQGNTNAKK